MNRRGVVVVACSAAVALAVCAGASSVVRGGPDRAAPHPPTTAPSPPEVPPREVVSRDAPDSPLSVDAFGPGVDCPPVAKLEGHDVEFELPLQEWGSFPLTMPLTDGHFLAPAVAGSGWVVGEGGVVGSVVWSPGECTFSTEDVVRVVGSVPREFADEGWHVTVCGYGAREVGSGRFEVHVPRMASCRVELVVRVDDAVLTSRTDVVPSAEDPGEVLFPPLVELPPGRKPAAECWHDLGFLAGMERLSAEYAVDLSELREVTEARCGWLRGDVHR